MHEGGMRWPLLTGIGDFELVLSIMIASNLRPLSRHAAYVVAFPQLSVSRFGTAAASHQRRWPAKVNRQHPSRAQTWKSPILSSSSLKETKQQSWSRDQQPQPSSVEPQRPPRLYKRTLLYGKQKDAVGDADANRLYRADRVLANRTGKSRKECFQLLQEGRVFRVIATTSNRNEDKSVSATEAVTLNSSSMQDSKDLADSLPSSRRTIHPLLEAVRGPSAKLSMHAELRIDKHQIVPLPPPLLAVYYKPKVREKCSA
jgi:hypothetical protein